MSDSLTSRVSYVVVAKIAGFVLGITVSPLLVRALGAARYGSYTFLFSLFGIYAILINTGVTNGVQKYLGERRATPHWAERVLAFYLRYGLLLAVVGGVIVLAVAESGVLSQFLDAPKLRYHLELLAVLSVAAQLRGYVQRSLLGFELERYNALLRVVYRVGFLALALGFVALGWGVGGVFIAHIVVSLFVSAVGLAIIGRRVSLVDVLGASTKRLPRREMLVFNNLSLALILLLTTLYHVDVISLRIFEGTTVTAHYKIALLFAEFLWFVPIALQTVLVQSASKLFERNEYDRIEAISARTTRYTALFTALMALGLAGLSPIVIPFLYGPDFAASIPPLLVLLPGAIGFAIARPILAIGQGSGQLRSMVLMAGVAAGGNLVLNLVLIPRFGMIGAATATTISYGSIPFLYALAARSIGFDPFADIRLLRILATVVVSGVPILWASRTIGSPILALLIVPAGGFVLFMTAAFLTGALGVDEVLEVLRSLPSPVGNWAADSLRRLTRSPVGALLD